MSKPINFYIITSTNTDKVYIGSTSSTLSVRLSQHKSQMDTTASEVINQGNNSIDLLETVECNSEERYKIEYKYIQGYGDLVVNCLRGHTKEPGYRKKRDKEYYQSNREYLLTKQKQYNIANKDKLSLTKNQKVKCECGKEVTKGNIGRHKKSKKHKDFIAL